jgi:hypothetical protein
MNQASSAGSDNPGTEDQDVTETVDVADSATEGQDAPQAQSSSAQDATESTLQDVIAAAVAPKADEAPESSAGDSSEEADESEGEADNTDGEKPAEAAKPEEEEQVPFHKHPRWQEKLQQERELKAQLEQFKSGHEQYEQIQGFMESNQLAPQEVADGFEIMALMRRDPKSALERLRPLVRDLELFTGERLPDDLEERVRDGVSDRETASEAARMRLLQQQREQEAQAAERRALEQQQQTAQTSAQAMQAAVAAVESELKNGDPDYAKKQAFIADRVRVLIQAERPSSPEAAVALVRRAHDDIGKQLGQIAKERRPVRAVRSADTPTDGRSEPKTMFDVVRQAAAGGNT